MCSDGRQPDLAARPEHPAERPAGQAPDCRNGRHGAREVTTARPGGHVSTVLLAAFALVAFAANSILCRAALGSVTVDPASFALVRLVSGAAMLLAIRAFARGDRARGPVDVVQPLALFAYAAAFSFAYVSLSAGTGALILFGCVQATILVGALRAGERFRVPEVVGLALALGGLAYLVAPGIAAPSLAGSVLMALAGMAWGVYTLRGRGSTDPLADTTRNFARAVLPALLLGVFAFRHLHMSTHGLVLAIASGAITSGLGYVLWFAALRGMTAIQAAIVQLAVPALAAAGGTALLGERITWRLVVAAALILGGVALAITLRSARTPLRR